MKLNCFTTWSCSDPGGHMARVRASSPSLTWPGPGELQLPRLQSMRALRMPLLPKDSVYFALSSDVRVLPSPPWNLTSCHEVPSSGGGPGGADAQAASSNSVARFSSRDNPGIAEV